MVLDNDIANKVETQASRQVARGLLTRKYKIVNVKYATLAILPDGNNATDVKTGYGTSTGEVVSMR